MKLTDIRKLLNDALAGDTLTASEMMSHLDFAIDEINTTLNAEFPTMSSLDYTDVEAEYTAFPDKYIRSVVIPGAAWHFYVQDEEGAVSSEQYQRSFNTGKFYMLRDYGEMLFTLEEQEGYRGDAMRGSMTGYDEMYTGATVQVWANTRL